MRACDEDDAFNQKIRDLVALSGLTWQEVADAVNGGDEVEITDVPRLVSACHAAGLKITAGEARAAWRKYSRDFCGEWLFLPDNDEDLVGHIRHWHKRDP
jgi:hypothetical protein